jgi:LysM repeat protein
MNQIFLFATQTAMSASGGTVSPGGGTPVAQGTPGAGETPAAGVTPGAGATPGGEGSVVPTQPGQQLPAPTQVTPLPPPPPLVVPATYTLQKGEFPFCIARRFNVDPSELLRINGLSSYSVFFAGMVLRIPQSGQTFPGNRALQPHPTTYTVNGGETIYTIACTFGDVDPDAIAYVNGLTPPYRLSPGQVLQIP